jgi:hypothetical protein
MPRPSRNNDRRLQRRQVNQLLQPFVEKLVDDVQQDKGGLGIVLDFLESKYLSLSILYKLGLFF